MPWWAALINFLASLVGIPALIEKKIARDQDIATGAIEQHDHDETASVDQAVGANKISDAVQRMSAAELNARLRERSESAPRV